MKQKQPESARSTFNSLSSHNRRGAILATFLAALLALACGTAHGDAYSLIDPSTLSAWASTVGNTDRPALYAVNGAGMNDDGTHASDAANKIMWMAGNGSIKTTSPARFVVTFAESVSLAGIKFWNFNWVNYADRGAKDIDIYCTANETAFSTASPSQTSVDDITNNWTAIKTDYVLPQASGTATYAGDNMITFAPVEAKYVAILVTSTYNGGYGGLSEVRFYESSDAPMLDDISLTRTGAASYSLSATVSANTADTLSWIADDGASTPVTNAFATAVAEGVTETVTISGLAADKTYKISVLAENSSGNVERTAGIIYTGTLSFGAATDAEEAGLVPGGVVVSRASADSLALDIDYTITGSAGTEGTTWAAPGTVTIPAGETSATLPVKPLIDISVTEDVAITVALASGNYEVPAAPATLTLVNAESLVAGFACDDFSGYTAAASISGKSPSKTGFASSAWTEDYDWPLKAQSTDLGFPEFLARTNLVGSVARSKGYKTSAKRELDVTTVPYTGTFYYRFVFSQSKPGEGYTWCNQNSWYHSGNSLGFSATSTVSQDFYAIFNNHKTIGAGPMPDANNSAIGIYLRTGWSKRTELVAPEDYEYDTDYLVCVEVTLSDSGSETFRAFAVKVADFSSSMISTPPWIDCTACGADIVSGSEPFKWVTFATHASSDENATIIFDEFAMGPTLKDIFQRVAKPLAIIIR